jgi:galactofuranose transport system permease protein
MSRADGRLLARARAARDALPLVTTCLIALLLYAAAALKYPGFFALQNTANLVGDNAVLGIAAVGLTFVILAGGIDLSCGAVIGCASIFIANMTEHHGWHPVAAIGVTLAAGVLMGFVSGALIHCFELPPFLVTLGGLFFARGVGLLISTESIGITHPLYVRLAAMNLPLSHGAGLPLVGVVFLVLLASAAWVAARQPLGRYVYALGGGEQSALLMGLPVATTKVAVYTIAGFCSALAGVARSVYTCSGDALNGAGLELDAIAAVVVGGTLLSGGVGSLLGTLVGVLIFGIIQSALAFDGRLSSWWSRIAVGLLLLAFILLQRLLQPRER